MPQKVKKYKCVGVIVKFVIKKVGEVLFFGFCLLSLLNKKEHDACNMVNNEEKQVGFFLFNSDSKFRFWT